MNVPGSDQASKFNDQEIQKMGEHVNTTRIQLAKSRKWEILQNKVFSFFNK
jgi:hypothetical protein